MTTKEKLAEIQDKCTAMVHKAEYRQGQYESGLLMLKDIGKLLGDVVRTADDCQGLAGEIMKADAKARNGPSEHDVRIDECWGLLNKIGHGPATYRRALQAVHHRIHELKKEEEAK